MRVLRIISYRLFPISMKAGCEVLDEVIAVLLHPPPPEFVWNRHACTTSAAILWQCRTRSGRHLNSLYRPGKLMAHPEVKEKLWAPKCVCFRKKTHCTCLDHVAVFVLTFHISDLISCSRNFRFCYSTYLCQAWLSAVALPAVLRWRKKLVD